MKIRTDFVTNSSSSSYTISVTIKDVSGNEYHASSDPDKIANYDSLDHNLTCSPREIKFANSVSDLLQLLIDSIQINKNYEWCETDELAQEMKEKDQEYATKEFIKLEKEITENISDLSQLKSIKLTRAWYACGEESSRFRWHLDTYAKNLPELAKKVCVCEGEEKESAKQELIDYLNIHSIKVQGEWQTNFPSEFLGARTRGVIEWKELTDDIEEFAKMVVAEDLPNYDYAEETTVIDMQNQTTDQKAKYILGGFKKVKEI